MPKIEDIHMKERIYDYIKDQIISRQLPGGAKIPEQKIAEQLGVSRTPVREAVRRLAWDGIVKISPNRSAEVIVLNDQTVEDFGIVRWTLDTLSVQLAAYNGSNREFDELRELADKCWAANKAGDLLKRIQYDSDFHLYMVKIGKNKILYDMQAKLHVMTQLWQANNIFSSEDMLEGLRMHTGMVDALEARDVSKAVALARQHLSIAFKTDFEERHKLVPNL